MAARPSRYAHSQDGGALLRSWLAVAAAGRADGRHAGRVRSVPGWGRRGAVRGEQKEPEPV